MNSDEARKVEYEAKEEAARQRKIAQAYTRYRIAIEKAENRLNLDLISFDEKSSLD